MLLFADGMQHYNSLIYKWTSAFAAHISSTGGRSAPQCLEIIEGGSAGKTLPLASTIFVGWALLLNEAEGLGNGTLYSASAIALDGGFVTLASLSTEPDGTLSVFAETPAGNLAGNTNGMSGPMFVTKPGVYYYIELEIAFSGNPIGITATLKVNTQILLNGVTANTVVAPDTLICQAAQVNYHNFGAGGAASAYVCDLYINDNTTVSGQPLASSFRGDIQVGPYIVPAVDQVTDWSGYPGIPPSYAIVNQVPPPGDSSYLYDANIGDYDTFSFTPVGAFVGEIQAAHYCLFMRKDNEGTRVVKPIVGNDVSELTAAYLSDEYYYYTYPMDVDPTTGAVWTVAGINAQVFGMKVYA